MTSPHHLPRDVPTPEQIRERCREVQRTWTERDERFRRSGADEPEPYEVPVVRVVQ